MARGKRKRQQTTPDGSEGSPSGSGGVAGLSTAIDDTVKSFFEGLINGLRTELDTKVSEIKDELRGSLHRVNERIDFVSDELEAEKDRNIVLEEKVNELGGCMEFIRERVLEQNAYSRRNNLKLFGIREMGRQGRGESVFDTLRVVLDFLNNRLQVRVSEQDICICHRLGDFEEGRHRTIIVKFVRRLTRVRILQQRHLLKRSGIVIAEDLSPETNRLFFELRDAIGAGNVWTRDGKIFANTPEGPKCVTRSNMTAVIDMVLHAARSGHRDRTRGPGGSRDGYRRRGGGERTSRQDSGRPSGHHDRRRTSRDARDRSWDRGGGEQTGRPDSDRHLVRGHRDPRRDSRDRGRAWGGERVARQYSDHDRDRDLSRGHRDCRRDSRGSRSRGRGWGGGQAARPDGDRGLALGSRDHRRDSRSPRDRGRGRDGDQTQHSDAALDPRHNSRRRSSHGGSRDPGDRHGRGGGDPVVRNDIDPDLDFADFDQNEGFQEMDEGHDQDTPRTGWGNQGAEGTRLWGTGPTRGGPGGSTRGGQGVRGGRARTPSF